MKEIDLPDGSIAEFPDDMTDDAIADVLRKQFPVGQTAAQAPVAGQPMPTSTWERFKAGMLDPVVGAGQLMDRAIVDPIRQAVFHGATSMNDVVAERNRGYVAPEGIDWARMGGTVANPLSWLGGGANTLRNLAASGAIQGAIAPTDANQSAGDFATEKAKQLAIGGAAGTVFGKLAQPFRPSADAEVLMQHGIQPTVGQAKGGRFNTYEEKLSSLPIVGDAISWARNRAGNEFQRRVISDATGGAADTVGAANQRASDLFDSVVPSLVPTREAVVNVQTALNRAMGNRMLTPELRDTLQGIVGDNFANFGRMTGPEIKRMDSQLGHVAREWASSGSPREREMSREIYRIQSAMREGLEPGLPPELQGVLREANTMYRNLIPVNKASSARADERITPRQWQKAVARQARTDVSRLDEGLVRSAPRVLDDRVPDSGTAGRAFLGGGTLLGGSTLGFLPQVLGIGGGSALGATRLGQSLLLGNTAPQRAIAPYAANIAGAGGAGATSAYGENGSTLLELRRELEKRRASR